MPGETLVIGCGGAGVNTVNHLKSITSINTKTINVGDHPDVSLLLAEGPISGCRGDSSIGAELANSNRDRIMDLIAGYDNIILTAGMGGGTGAGILPVVAECARSQNSKVISVITLPMSFEALRRDISMSQTYEVIKASDRTVVFDMDIIQDNGGNPIEITNILFATDEILSEAIIRLVEIVKGLFSSILDEKTYTVAYANGGTFSQSVRKAMKGRFFENDGYVGKPVIYTDSEITKSDRNNISKAVGDENGSIPEIISGTDNGTTGLMAFIPIVFRA